MAAMRASTLMGTSFAGGCLASGGAGGAATVRAASAAYRSAARPAGKSGAVSTGQGMLLDDCCLFLEQFQL